METESNLNSISKVLKTSRMVKEYFEHNYLTNTSDEKVLYIHIPYCVRKCKYCVCQSNVMAEKTEIRKYIEEVVLHQLAEYTDLLGKVKIDQLYIGGGDTYYFVNR